MVDPSRRKTPEEASTAELIGRLSDDLRTLVRDELRLARLELKQKGKRAGIGAGLIGGAGIVALFGVGTLIAAAVLALGLAMPYWLSAFLVGVALLVVAGVLGLVGRDQAHQATPPVPEDAIDGVRKDVDAMKGGS